MLYYCLGVLFWLNWVILQTCRVQMLCESSHLFWIHVYFLFPFFPRRFNLWKKFDSRRERVKWKDIPHFNDLMTWKWVTFEFGFDLKMNFYDPWIVTVHRTMSQAAPVPFLLGYFSLYTFHWKELKIPLGVQQSPPQLFPLVLEWTTGNFVYMFMISLDHLACLHEYICL